MANDTASTTDTTRDLILAAAVDLFAEHGYLGTSISDIADAIGLTKGAVFYYFPRKADLLAEIHDAFISILIERAEERVPRKLAPKDEVEALIRDVMWLMEHMNEHVRVFFQEWRHLEGPTLSEVKAKRDRYANHLMRVLEAGVAEGQFRPMRPELVMLFVFGVVNWAYQWYVPRGLEAHEEVLDAMVLFVERGIQR